MTQCPPPADVERVYWTMQEGRPLASRDVDAHAHILDCASCNAAWTEIAELAKLGATLEPSPFQRREEVRTTLLSKIEAPAAIPAYRRWIAPLAIAAAAAVVAIALWPTPAPVPHRRAEVLAHGSAQAITVTDQPDEIVRLVDGTITVTVPALSKNERFRVFGGDEVVTASDAAFDVTAKNDRIVAMRVMHGQVELFATGTTKTLRAGETWRDSVDIAVAPPPPQPVIAVAPPPPQPVIPPTPQPEPKSIEHPTRTLGELGPPASTAPPPTVEPDPIPTPAPDAALPELPPRSMTQQAFDDGWAALRAGDFPRAAKAFERTLAITSDAHVIEDATFWRGVALARGGEVATAAHVLTAFVTAYPESARTGEARVMLGWLLFERGDIADARAQFEAAVKDGSQRVRDSAHKGLDAIAKKSR